MRFLKVLFLFVGVIFFAVSCGSGDSDSDGPGICDVCEGNISESNCEEGWCASFTIGPTRCVPNDIGPNDPYTCTISN